MQNWGELRASQSEQTQWPAVAVNAAAHYRSSLRCNREHHGHRHRHLAAPAGPLQSLRLRGHLLLALARCTRLHSSSRSRWRSARSSRARRSSRWCSLSAARTRNGCQSPYTRKSCCSTCSRHRRTSQHPTASGLRQCARCFIPSPRRSDALSRYCASYRPTSTRPFSRACARGRAAWRCTAVRPPATQTAPAPGFYPSSAFTALAHRGRAVVRCCA